MTELELQQRRRRISAKKQESAAWSYRGERRQTHERAAGGGLFVSHPFGSLRQANCLSEISVRSVISVAPFSVDGL